MTNSSLPKTGVQAVVEGLPSFVKDITTVNNAIGNSGKVAADAAKKITPANAALGGLNDKLKGLTQQTGPAGNAISGILDKIGGIPPSVLLAVGAIGLLVAAVVGLGAAFIELGKRGAPLQEIGHAFDILTAQVGINSQDMLKSLRAASEGTVSDFDLIKTASTALLGVTGDFGKQFGQSIPQLLKIAKVEADATGRSVNDLFNNLVEGIKKGTPKLIENTGLIIDQKAAYQDYANTLGITVGQLSDVDKSTALLNATVSAGAVAIDTLGSAQESNADKLDRINATITNTFDGLAVAVQPIFGAILDGVQKILNVFAGFAPYLAVIFNFVGGIIAKLVNKIGNIIPPDLPKRLFEGAAAAFGSFANGIIAVANKLIFPAVIAIAKFIADFLIGFSPPKEGPLSVIDKGGENLMLAWLDGISGVSLDPVKQVAQQVSDALGAIGTQSLPQVNARLAQLDKALQPFQNRLDIIKAQFDAFNEPAKAALDAIDSQTSKLLDASAQGDAGATEKLKVLDAQRQTIQDQVDLQQGLVDRATIQLGLAKAQQAPERALLTIRQAQLNALAQTQAQTGGGEAKTPKEKKAAAGAGSIDTNAGTSTGGVAIPSGAGSVLDLVGGQDKIDAAAQGISDAFNGAIDQTGLQDFAQNSLDLGGQLDRIKSVDLGAKIQDKFKGLSDAFDPSVAGSIANNIFQFFNGDATNPNSLSGIINSIGNSLNIDDAVGKINAEFAWITDPKAEGSPANIFATLTADSGTTNSIAWFLAALPARITEAVAGIPAAIKTSILDPISSFLIGTAPGSLSDIINQAVGFFTGLPTRIVGALIGIGQAVYSALAIPVIQAINGLIGGVEQGLQLLVDKIAGFVDSIVSALGDVAPAFLKDAAVGLHGTKVSFGRISTELPAFLNTKPLAGATGGLFSKGFMTVGEKGTELQYNASKVGIIPHELTSVLLSLQSILAQPQAIPVMAGGNNYSNSTSNMNVTMNGVQGANDAVRRFSRLRAGS